MDKCTICNKRKWFGKYENNRCDKCNDTYNKLTRYVPKFTPVSKSSNYKATHSTVPYTSNYSVKYEVDNHTYTNAVILHTLMRDDSDYSSVDSHCDYNHDHSDNSYDSGSSNSSYDSSSYDSSSDCSCDCGGCD